MGVVALVRHSTVLEIKKIDWYNTLVLEESAVQMHPPKAWEEGKSGDLEVNRVLWGKQSGLGCIGVFYVPNFLCE